MSTEHELFHKENGASDGKCVEMTHQKCTERLWKDDPCKMGVRVAIRAVEEETQWTAA